MAREVWITGIGLTSSLGEGTDAHWQAMAVNDPPRPVVDRLRARTGLARDLGITAGGHDPPVAHQHAAVFLVAAGGKVVGAFRPAREGQRAAAQQKLAHLTAFPGTRRPAARVPPASSG